MEAGYQIEKKLSENKVIIHFAGFTKPEMVADFMRDYEELRKSINVSETELVLDGKTLKVFPVEFEKNLIKIYESYTNFKKVYLTNPNAILTKMQIKRVLKKAGIESKFQFIDDVNSLT